MFGPREPEDPLYSAPSAADDPELGATSHKTHDPDREIRLLEGRAGSERDPEGRAFAPLADAYRRAGRLDEAARVVEEGTNRLPDYATGHVVAGLVHRDRGDGAAARSSFHRALELDPANRTALRTLAEIHLESGEVAEARRCCDRLEEAGSEDERLRERLEYPAPPDAEAPRPGEESHPDAYADPSLASEPAAGDPGDSGPGGLEQGGPGDAGLLDLGEGSLDLDPSGLHEASRGEPALPSEPEAEQDLDRGEGEGLDLDLDLSGLEDAAAGTEEALGAMEDAAPGSGLAAGEEDAAPGEDATAGDDATAAGDATPADHVTPPEEAAPVADAPLEEVPSDGLLPLDPSDFEDPSAGGPSPGERDSPGGELESPEDEFASSEDELDPGPAGTEDPLDRRVGLEPEEKADAPGLEDSSGGHGPSALAAGSRGRDFLDPEELDASALGLDPFEAGRGAFGTAGFPGSGRREEETPEPGSDPAGMHEPGPGHEPEGVSEPEVEGSFEPEAAHSAGESGGGLGSGGAGDPVTRTMGDLYAAQGHYDRAVAVYEQLAAMEPGDFQLRARLEELRAQARRASEGGAESAGLEEGGGDGDAPGPDPAPPAAPGPADEGRGSPPEPEGQAPQWVEEAERDEELGFPSPFAWAEEAESSEIPESGGEEASPATGRSARQYFDDLLAWVPGAVPIENLAPDGPTDRAEPGTSRLDRGGAHPSDATGAGEEVGEGDLDDFQSWLGRFGP